MLYSLLIPITLYLTITTPTIRWLIKLLQLELKRVITSLEWILILLGTITTTRTYKYHSTIRAITTLIPTSWIALLTKIMCPFQVKTCLLMRNLRHRTTLTYGMATITITMHWIRITFGAVNLNNLRHSLILRLRTISGHSSNRPSSLLITRDLLIWLRIRWVLRTIKWEIAKSPQTTPIRIIPTTILHNRTIITPYRIQYSLIATTKTVQAAVIHILKCNRLTF